MTRARTRGSAGSTACGGKGDASGAEGPSPPHEGSVNVYTISLLDFNDVNPIQ